MFHVPERWRVTDHPLLGSTARDGNNGTFDLASCEPGWMLAILASDGEGWEHVSVHAYRGRPPREQDRTPSWKEMCFVKRLFWDGDDVVMQLHPREADYINLHPHCLHLWRPIGAEILTPRRELVGV